MGALAPAVLPCSRGEPSSMSFAMGAFSAMRSSGCCDYIFFSNIFFVFLVSVREHIGFFPEQFFSVFLVSVREQFFLVRASVSIRSLVGDVRYILAHVWVGVRSCALSSFARR